MEKKDLSALHDEMRRLELQLSTIEARLSLMTDADRLAVATIRRRVNQLHEQCRALTPG